MTTPNKFLIEGIDRLGKNELLDGIQHRCGYHLTIHYQKPIKLTYYSNKDSETSERQYQEASFRTMFQLLRGEQETRIIFNRAHIGECVYAPVYRKYSGDYVFEIEREFKADELPRTRLILLTEDFSVSRHFIDDGKSLGGPTDIKRRGKEQDLFLAAFDRSIIKDKKIICVTNRSTGAFMPRDWILTEALAT
ncbi:hypothetical protein HPC50_40375 [Corallococcus exiguus]|uniref:hypothetical protein n=1 Tax=Corallococcus TaxID=83461 RepID=UPI0011C38773|nr:MULTISPECIES: hypothetical protein [Corallococcus]NPC53304.1 hypothetical protein [Corallococcus exiguus]